MKKEENKTGFLKRNAAALWFILIGGACGLVIIPILESAADITFGKYMVILVLLILVMYAVIFIQMIIHEAGHLVFGLLSGYRFSSFRIGSIMWIKDNGRIKLRKMTLAGTGGQCLMSPPTMENGRIPYVLYNLGGSLMNLIAALIFMLVYIPAKDSPYFSAFCLLMVIVGVGLALMNGIPMRLGTIDNDGYNAVSLGKSPDALRSFWVQMKVMEQSARGIRLKDMPVEWFVCPDDDGLKNSMTSVMAVFCENRLIDEHRFAEAAELIDRLCSADTAIIGLYRSMMTCDRIYCGLLAGEDKDAIRGMVTDEQKKFMQQMKSNPSVIRTSYALSLLCENDAEAAEKSRAVFEKIASSYPYTGDIENERELIEIADKAAGKNDGSPAAL